MKQLWKFNIGRENVWRENSEICLVKTKQNITRYQNVLRSKENGARLLCSKRSQENSEYSENSEKLGKYIK